MREQEIQSEQVLIFVDTLLAQYDDVFGPLSRELDFSSKYLLMLQAQPSPNSEEIEQAKLRLKDAHEELRRQLKQVMPMLNQQSAEFKSLLLQSQSQHRK